MTKRRLTLFVLALAVGLALAAFFIIRPAPPVVWLGTIEQGFQREYSVLANWVSRIKKAASELLGLHAKNPTRILLGSELLSGPRDSVDAVTPAKPDFTNGAGARVWLLTVNGVEGFTARIGQEGRLKPSVICSPRIVLSDGELGARIVSRNGVKSLIGIPTSAPMVNGDLVLPVVAQLRGDAILVTVGAEFIEAGGHAPGSEITMLRTNFNFALRVKIPNGGGILVQPAALQSNDDTEYLLLVVPHLMNFRGKALQLPAKPVGP